MFLDFAEAFDKVDHSILMRKVIKHKIKGKLGRWIMEFLSNRKFIVIANGTKSDPEDVLSGVLQGTLPAAVQFIIISDIDEEIKKCIVRFFADDTRVSNKIKTENDKWLASSVLNGGKRFYFVRTKVKVSESEKSFGNFMNFGREC